MNNAEIKKGLLAARDEFISLIRAELLGPGSEFSFPDAEHELISSNPISRYSMGILFPQGNLIEQDSNETVEIDAESTETNFSDTQSTQSENSFTVTSSVDHTYEKDETADENLDEEVGLACQYKPSSMGLTFLASGNTDTVCCRVSFATYRNALLSDCVLPYVFPEQSTYIVPSSLVHIMRYDNAHKQFVLVSAPTAKELRTLFEDDTLPEKDFILLKKIAYRLLDFLAKGYVRVPHVIENVTLDFSKSNYAEDADNSSLDQCRLVKKGQLKKPKL